MPSCSTAIFQMGLRCASQSQRLMASARPKLRTALPTSLQRAMTHVQDFSPLVDSPMYVVTCKQGDESAGCLVGFATQCSIQPPRFLVCLSIANRTYRVADGASALAIHVLAGKDRRIASLFGEQTGDDVDKFAAVPWHLGITGAPILTDCAASFEGRIVAKIPFGDHVGFVLAPVDEIDAPTEVEGAQLTLRDVESFEPGHPADEAIAQRCRGEAVDTPAR